MADRLGGVMLTTRDSGTRRSQPRCCISWNIAAPNQPAK